MGVITISAVYFTRKSSCPITWTGELPEGRGPLGRYQVAHERARVLWAETYPGYDRPERFVVNFYTDMP